MALKAYAADWRKIRKKRMKPTGMGQYLDTQDKVFGDYLKLGRTKFVETVSGPNSAASDDTRYLKGFKDAVVKIKGIQSAHTKDWTTQEAKFISDMLRDLGDEVSFWNTKPCSKKYL